MAISETAAQQFFTDYGDKLFNTEALSLTAFLQPPLLIISEDGSVPVSNQQEAEQAIADWVAETRDSGAVATRVTLNDFKAISENLCSAKIAWQWLAPGDTPNGITNFYYILQQRSDTSLAIVFCASIQK